MFRKWLRLYILLPLLTDRVSVAARCTCGGSVDFPYRISRRPRTSRFRGRGNGDITIFFGNIQSLILSRGIRSAGHSCRTGCRRQLFDSNKCDCGKSLKRTAGISCGIDGIQSRVKRCRQRIALLRYFANSFARTFLPQWFRCISTILQAHWSLYYQQHNATPPADLWDKSLLSG